VDTEFHEGPLQQQCVGLVRSEVVVVVWMGTLIIGKNFEQKRGCHISNKQIQYDSFAHSLCFNLNDVRDGFVQ
jgi:hypothetical protein